MKEDENMAWDYQKAKTESPVNPPIYNDNNYMIAWNSPGRHQNHPAGNGNLQTNRDVMVGPWPDHRGWSNHYTSTSGHCNSHFHHWTEERQAQSLINLAFMIACDGVPIDHILIEFSKIGVWQRMGYLLPDGQCQRAFIDGDAEISPHLLSLHTS